MNEKMCDFCFEILVDYDAIEPKTIPCCDDQKLIQTIDSSVVCTSCGRVDSILYTKEYIDFYENMYNIRQKSMYNGKYHIENIFNSFNQKRRIEISYENRQKIHNIFKLIDKVLSQVHGGS